MAYPHDGTPNLRPGAERAAFNPAPRYDPAISLDALFEDFLAASASIVNESEGERILGALKSRERLVILNDRHSAELEANPGLRRFTIGHEIGHWLLHADAARSGMIPLDGDGRTWCRSGAADQTERQAEMFSGRLLVLRDLLVPQVVIGGWTGWGPVYELAKTFVVTPTAMIVRARGARACPS